MTLSDLKWPFQASRVTIAELRVGLVHFLRFAAVSNKIAIAFKSKHISNQTVFNKIAASDSIAI